VKSGLASRSPFDYPKSMRYFYKWLQQAAAGLEAHFEKSASCCFARRYHAYLQHFAVGASLPFGDL
jgi:hypothetical protein